VERNQSTIGISGTRNLVGEIWGSRCHELGMLRRREFFAAGQVVFGLANKSER
jgi:hypothetical protein